jgi:hypothetical protein
VHVEPLLPNIPDPFLGNGSVNTNHSNESTRNSRGAFGNEPFLRGPYLILKRTGATKSEARVEPGSNTSTIILPVVGEDGKGTHCLGL